MGGMWGHLVKISSSLIKHWGFRPLGIFNILIIIISNVISAVGLISNGFFPNTLDWRLIVFFVKILDVLLDWGRRNLIFFRLKNIFHYVSSLILVRVIFIYRFSYLEEIYFIIPLDNWRNLLFESIRFFNLYGFH